MMATEAELRDALAAGRRFQPAIRKATYRQDTDQVVLATPWGEKLVYRTEIEEFQNVPIVFMHKIYASEVGLHIDDMDIDINSAGLLHDLFPDLRSNLSDSF